MTILFIENRYKTYFYEPIIKNLIDDGYEIHWIVQNSDFKVNVGKNHIIKYPKQQNITIDEIKFKDVITSDRQLNYFNKKDKTYIVYYYLEIKKIIEQVKPTIIFGESTAFHELLAIQVAKELDILYLNPCSSRYPVGRFSFYEYDTLNPYKGSGEIFNDEESTKIISSITNRKVKPDYMVSKKNSIYKKINNKLKLIFSYYKGEKYNTPSPYIKYLRENKLKKDIEQWNNIAINTIDAHFSILYPMQMQPEANIGVWGRKYRDQLDNITKIHKQLKKDEILYVKLNPKCKYELTTELINFIKSKKNIIPLELSMKMDEVLPKMDLVITVTGTVAIESILTNIPVITLINTINNTNKNCVFLQEINQVSEIITHIKSQKFPKINEQEKINFINVLTETSYKGIVSNPFDDLKSVSEENIKNMVFAFKKILVLQ